MCGTPLIISYQVYQTGDLASLSYLTEQQIAAIRGEARIDYSDEDARHRAAVRRARVREAQVRAAMAAIPEQRSDDMPQRSPLSW